jgi:hypothetical protein
MLRKTKWTRRGPRGNGRNAKEQGRGRRSAGLVIYVNVGRNAREPRLTGLSKALDEAEGLTYEVAQSCGNIKSLARINTNINSEYKQEESNQ